MDLDALAAMMTMMNQAMMIQSGSAVKEVHLRNLL